MHNYIVYTIIRKVNFSVTHMNIYSVKFESKNVSRQVKITVDLDHNLKPQGNNYLMI